MEEHCRRNQSLKASLPVSSYSSKIDPGLVDPSGHRKNGPCCR